MVLCLFLLFLGLFLSCNFSFRFCLNSFNILRIFLLLSCILLSWTRSLLYWWWRWSNFFLLLLFFSLSFRNSRLLWRIIRFFDASSRGRSIRLELFLLLLLLRFWICFPKSFIYIGISRFATSCALGNKLKQFISSLDDVIDTSGSRPATIFCGFA